MNTAYERYVVREFLAVMLEDDDLQDDDRRLLATCIDEIVASDEKVAAFYKRIKEMP
jgi:hypothetical protein